MALKATSYTPDLREDWSRFLDRSANGTLFHDLDFLAYHGDRFAGQEEHLVWLKGEEVVAVLPLSVAESEAGLVARSPYGASWGGIAHAMKFSLDNALDAISMLGDFFRERGVDRAVITMPPPYCWTEYTNYAEFALIHYGFRPSISELTHVIVLSDGSSPMDVHTTSARTQIRKAQKAGVVIERDAALDVVYPLLAENRSRVGGDMTHSLGELEEIQHINPAFIKADAAWIDGRLVAANVYLNTRRALLSFYPSYDPDFAHTSALSLLIHDAVVWSAGNGFNHIDLGCSSYRTHVPNRGVARFKENLGASGFFRTTYEWRSPEERP